MEEVLKAKYFRQISTVQLNWILNGEGCIVFGKWVEEVAKLSPKLS